MTIQVVYALIFILLVMIVALILYKRSPHLVERCLSQISRHQKRTFVHRNLLNHIPQTGVLVDLGSGDGHITDHIQSARPRLQVIPMDIVDLHLTAKPPPRIFNGRDIPMETGSVDMVLLCFVLHHTEHPSRLVEEAARILKPAGQLLIVEDVVESSVDQLLTAIHGWSSYGKGSFHSVVEWKRLLRAASSLRITETQQISRLSHPLYPVSRRLFKLS